MVPTPDTEYSCDSLHWLFASFRCMRYGGITSMFTTVSPQAPFRNLKQCFQESLLLDKTSNACHTLINKWRLSTEVICRRDWRTPWWCHRGPGRVCLWVQISTTSNIIYRWQVASIFFCSTLLFHNRAAVTWDAAQSAARRARFSTLGMALLARLLLLLALLLQVLFAWTHHISGCFTLGCSAVVGIQARV